MRHHIRRTSVAIVSIGALCVVTALSGAATAAGAKGIKGDPQPELKPFTLSTSDSAGTVAIDPNGNLVVAYAVPTSNGAGKTEVCVLARGGHTCTHKSTLNPLSGDSIGDVTQVFALPGNHVVVLQNTCCDANPAGGDLLFTSTNGGSSFGAPSRVGVVDVGAATLAGGNIVFAGANAHVGWQVESVAANAVAGPATTAVLGDEQPVDLGMSNYKGGVLAAADFDGPTKVKYAASGKDPNASASYVSVGSFSGEQLMGISGNALLTLETTDNDHLQVRYFNGTTFGAPHNVPDIKGHDLGLWTTIDKDPAGVTHVFTESEFGTPSYALEEVSTTSGTHWSGQTDLGNAINSDNLHVDLDSIGSGLVLGTDQKAIGYPVLAGQSVSFSLSKSSVKKRHKVTGKGKGKAAAKGRKIELQVEKSGRWYNVASTHESSSGAFKFAIKGSKVGKFHYRAVAADHAGYVQFGYSSARTLVVRK